MREDTVTQIASYLLQAEMLVQTVITTPATHESKGVWPSAWQNMPPVPWDALCAHVIAPGYLRMLSPLASSNAGSSHATCPNTDTPCAGARGQCSPRSHGCLALSVNSCLLRMAGLQPWQMERASWHMGWHMGLLCTSWRCPVWWHRLLRDLHHQKLHPTPAMNKEWDVPFETQGALQ